MRIRSHSPAPSGPGLSQIAFETPRRPRSCTRPARRSVSTSAAGRPSTRPRVRGELGDRARVPERVGRLEVDEVGDGRQRGVERRRPCSRRRSAGSAATTASQVRDGVEPRRRAVRRPPHERRPGPGSNWPPARLRARATAASTPPTRWATSTYSASWEIRAASGICSPASRPGPAATVPALVGRRDAPAASRRRDRAAGPVRGRARRAARSCRRPRGARRGRTPGRRGTGAAAGCPPR